MPSGDAACRKVAEIRELYEQIGVIQGHWPAHAYYQGSLRLTQAWQLQSLASTNGPAPATSSLSFE